VMKRGQAMFLLKVRGLQKFRGSENGTGYFSVERVSAHMLEALRAEKKPDSWNAIFP